MKFGYALFAFLGLLLVTSGCGVGLCVNGWCTVGVSSLNLTAKWQRLDASWGSAARVSGYLLVRNAGSAVSWSPTQGQV
jgi:hypothetical protein